ncbi:hypothetical protein ACEQ8H_007639 [Pleosporales sp. CAS-2024a]
MLLHLTALVISLVTLVTALPAPAASSAFDMSYTVSNLLASTWPATSNSTNSTSFLVSDTQQAHIFVCAYTVNGALFNSSAWHDCVPYRGTGMHMSFQFTDGFEQMGLQIVSSDTSGMPMTGYATQPTDWDENEGGNVTITGPVKHYKHMGNWVFGVNALVA